MLANFSSHKENCMCPGCRSARGEKWATKQRFTTSMNTTLLTYLREWARRHNTSLTTAIEQAVETLLRQEQQEIKKQRIEKVFREEPLRTDIREYTSEEISEWEEADKLEPELAAKVNSTIKTMKKARKKQ